MYLYLQVCVGCNFLANHTAIFSSSSNSAVYGQFEICRRGPFILLVKFSNLSEGGGGGLTTSPPPKITNEFVKGIPVKHFFFVPP